MQSNSPDDGRKHRPKHVETIWNNKLIYIVHLVGYFHSCITMHGFVNIKWHIVTQTYKWYWLLENILCVTLQYLGMIALQTFRFYLLVIK
jgi:hypothetical protein